MVDIVDDMVVFGGGSSDGSKTDLLETLNTTSMEWTTNRLQIARESSGHGVSYGWVLYYGGQDNFGTFLESWEAHNLKTGASLNGTKSPKSLAYSGSVAGKVIVAGGMTEFYEPLDTVDIWDGNSGEWSQSVAPEARGIGDSAVVGDCFYMLSGYDSSGAMSEKAFFYNMTSESWGTFSFSVARIAGGVAVLGTKIFYAGGFMDGAIPYYGNIDVYDVSTGILSTIPMAVARQGALPFAIGNVLGVAGGTTISDRKIGPWEMHDLVTGKNWTINFGEAKSEISGARVNGMMLLAGGALSNGDSDRLDIFSCTSCIPGTAGDQGYQPCRMCQAGTSSIGGNSNCTKCPAGKFSEAGSDTCQTCPAGMISSVGSRNCTTCQNATSPAENSSECVLCSAGTHSDGQGLCVPCAAGYYQEKSGMFKCEQCQTGTNSGLGATVCVSDQISTKSGSKDKSSAGAIAGAVVGAIVLFAVVIGAVLFIVKRRRTLPLETEMDDKKNESKPEYVPIKSEMTVATDAVTAKHKDNDWEIPFSELVFDENNLLGAGNFGDVYYGEWRGIPVAIKKFKKDGKHFREEVALVKNLRPHLNVVQFYGACTKEPQPMCLVAEYLSAGSLIKFMKDNVMTKKEIAEVLCGAAAGLNHLHSEGLVHRDVAARNVLLSRVGNKLIAKISDFGLSRNVSSVKEDATESEAGPTRWMSPESLKDREFSAKSDVWSFGVLCWEAVFNAIPFQELDDFTAGAKVAYEKARLNIPNEGDWPQLHQIMMGCFKEDPKDRFEMAQIVDLLKSWESTFNIVDSREL